MKAKILMFGLIASLTLAAPEAFAKKRVVRSVNGRTIVTNTGNHHWRHFNDSSVSWNIGIGVGVPFYGGYYGYPGYGAYYPYATAYSPFSYGYSPYGYGYYPYNYGYYPYRSYYSGGYPYGYTRSVYTSGYGYDSSIVARVQRRLARDGYYRGPIDGVIGPRTRYAIRAYERSHGLPVDGVIDRRLLANMGLA